MNMTQTELGLLVAAIALGGVVFGSLVAGGFALITGWIDSRREHRRWLRGELFRAVAEYGEIATLASTPGFKPSTSERAELQHQFSDVLSRLNILADQEFRDSTTPSLVHAHLGAAGRHAPAEEVEAGLTAYYRAAKKVLRVK